MQEISVLHISVPADRPVLHDQRLLRNGDVPHPVRDGHMMNYDLMEVLRWDRKTILKPPDWNRPRQMELFGDFLC